MTKAFRGALSVVFFFLSLSIPITCVAAKEFQTREPDAVAGTLRSGNPTQRSQLATELEIMAPNFSDPGAKSNAPCVTFDRVDERQVHLRADADNAVIVADSGECDSTYLIVFDKERKGEWRHVQTVRVSAHITPPEVSFVELVQAGVFEVVVRHETTHDTGSARQENFMVLKLLHNRLLPVLDTVARYDLVMPNVAENDADNVEQTQQSTFTVVKAETNTGPPSRIREREVLKQQKTTLTLYRYWSWDPGLERFRATAYDGSKEEPVAPLAAKPPAKKAGAAGPEKK